MSRRRIGQESFGFGDGRTGAGSSLDDLAQLIDWTPIWRGAGGRFERGQGRAGRPPLPLFKALPLSVWHDLSDVKRAEALDERGSFRRFCGFSALEPTAFMRFRKPLAARGLDEVLVETIPARLKARALRVKTGMPAKATIIASASLDEGEAHWVKSKGRPAVHGFKARGSRRRDRAGGRDLPRARQGRRWPGRSRGATG
jgi:IS5 family transposase